MEVILKRDVPNVGRIGEIVKVKNGYARNFLLPRSLAVVAGNGNVKSLEHHRRLIEKEKAAVRKESEDRAADISKISLSLKKRFNDQDKMFGSVTVTELVVLFKAKGFDFDRRDIEIPSITDAGTFELKIRLPGDVFTTAQLKIDAVKEKVAKKKKVAAKKETKDSAEPKTEKAE